jgi:hypothetical protein
MMLSSPSPFVTVIDLFILEEEQLTQVVAPGNAFKRPSGIASLHLTH